MTQTKFYQHAKTQKILFPRIFLGAHVREWDLTTKITRKTSSQELTVSIRYILTYKIKKMVKWERV